MQLLVLDGIAEHAAVHESVELVKQRVTPGAPRLVTNADPAAGHA